MSQSNKSGRKTCTCKYLPWNLSTNTAAEYGDLGSLSHRITHGKTSAATSEPLHLAAQHGHIAVTSYLLQNGYNADSGSKDAVCEPNNSTPLHRACYSGAIGCVKLLLDHDANLLCRDNSFFDGMTPLHKAVKGGRYHVVALILKHCTSEKILNEILEARDSPNRTPLELALELDSKGEEEILSLRRWDNVAGGLADFAKCVELLESALKEDGYSVVHDGKGSSYDKATPIELTPYCECGDEDEDKCKTSAWEKSFAAAILKSTESMMTSGTRGKRNTRENQTEKETTQDNDLESSSLTCKKNVTAADIDTNAQTLSEPNGHPCALCKHESLALFRSAKGNLVCRKCLRRSKYRR